MILLTFRLAYRRRRGNESLTPFIGYNGTKIYTSKIIHGGGCGGEFSGGREGDRNGGLSDYRGVFGLDRLGGFSTHSRASDYAAAVRPLTLAEKENRPSYFKETRPIINK